jgi:hypothetical protein
MPWSICPAPRWSRSRSTVPGGQLHHRPDGTITASSQAAIPVARGALITLEGPATPDTGAAQIGLTLIGTRT